MKIKILNMKIHITETREEHLRKSPAWGMKRFKWQEKEKDSGRVDREGLTGNKRERRKNRPQTQNERERGSFGALIRTTEQSKACGKRDSPHFRSSDVYVASEIQIFPLSLWWEKPDIASCLLPWKGYLSMLQTTGLLGSSPRWQAP